MAVRATRRRVSLEDTTTGTRSKKGLAFRSNRAMAGQSLCGAVLVLRVHDGGHAAACAVGIAGLIEAVVDQVVAESAAALFAGSLAVLACHSIRPPNG